VTESDVAELRERLVTMRADLVGRLVARMDGGEMALLGSVGAAIAAVDAMQKESTRELGDPGDNYRSDRCGGPPHL
jgi:hypothetical protein